MANTARGPAVRVVSASRKHEVLVRKDRTMRLVSLQSEAPRPGRPRCPVARGVAGASRPARHDSWVPPSSATGAVSRSAGLLAARSAPPSGLRPMQSGGGMRSSRLIRGPVALASLQSPPGRFLRVAAPGPEGVRAKSGVVRGRASGCDDGRASGIPDRGRGRSLSGAGRTRRDGSLR